MDVVHSTLEYYCVFARRDVYCSKTKIIDLTGDDGDDGDD